MRKTINALSIALATAAATAVVAQVVAVCYEVTARYVFNRPTFWSLEITEYLLVVAVFLSLAYVLKQNAHVRLTILVQHLSERTGAVIGAITCCLSVICCCVFIWQSAELAFRSLAIGRHSVSLLASPLFPVQVLIPIGLLIIVLQYLVLIADYVRLLRRSSDV